MLFLPTPCRLTFGRSTLDAKVNSHHLRVEPEELAVTLDVESLQLSLHGCATLTLAAAAGQCGLCRRPLKKTTSRPAALQLMSTVSSQRTLTHHLRRGSQDVSLTQRK